MNPAVEILHDTPWVKLLRRGQWTYASRRRPSDPLRIDAVSIIPWHVTEHSLGAAIQPITQLVVIEEFREPIQGWEIALPAGLVEDDEKPEIAAVREFQEETGLIVDGVGTATNIPLFSSAGLTDETSCFVEVFCRGTPAQKPGVDGEKIKVHLLNRDRTLEMLSRAERREVFMSARLWPILNCIAQTGAYAGHTV